MKSSAEPLRADQHGSSSRVRRPLAETRISSVLPTASAGSSTRVAAVRRPVISVELQRGHFDRRTRQREPVVVRGDEAGEGGRLRVRSGRGEQQDQEHQGSGSHGQALLPEGTCCPTSDSAGVDVRRGAGRVERTSRGGQGVTSTSAAAPRGRTLMRAGRKPAGGGGSNASSGSITSSPGASAPPVRARYAWPVPSRSVTRRSRSADGPAFRIVSMPSARETPEPRPGGRRRLGARHDDGFQDERRGHRRRGCRRRGGGLRQRLVRGLGARERHRGQRDRRGADEHQRPPRRARHRRDPAAGGGARGHRAQLRHEVRGGPGGRVLRHPQREQVRDVGRRSRRPVAQRAGPRASECARSHSAGELSGPISYGERFPENTRYSVSASE